MKTVAGMMLCGVIILVAGCASFGSSMRSWLGRSEKELLAEWGKPATTTADGHGGRILTYYAITERVANNDPATVERAAGLVREPNVARGDRPAQIDHVPADVTVREFRQRNFWVDATGTIYSCSWQSPPGLFSRTPGLESASLRSG